ncbi:unnamed protein product [Cuscuta campestris]|uniref:Reverse transcriptase domain-containing protein n=1 Tax=Cuscuta campestris TaxID=132261 RepID=A0A484LBA5_9ASTE|nr:unnamed protein product [Cuscuta campestris]
MISWNASSSTFWISSVYGLHSRVEREGLWTSLRSLALRSEPWIIGGDFNTVVSITEHKGEVCPDLGSIRDFANAISDCELVSPPFLGSQFTWTGKRGRGRVFRRLDRILLNESCMDSFPVLEVRHLGRGLSDHRPLLVKAFPNNNLGPKPFRFLNVWCSHDSFKDLIACTWGQNYQGGGMRGLAVKLTVLKKALIKWNKEVFGNIFDEVSKAEERLLSAERTFENDDCEANVIECNLATALLQQAHKKEEAFWSQKANVRWIAQGDASTAFFHSFVKGRRNRLFISSLKNDGGTLLSSQEEIAKAAVDHFTKVFSNIHEGDMGEILGHIPSFLLDEDNAMLGSLLDEEEIRKAIWKLNANSTVGADGYNGFFFRQAWDVIKVDVLKAVQEFFLGIPLPKAFGSTLITLIPKVEGAITLDQFRPISLSTFFSKILSRILSDRLKKVLPSLISPEQAAFQSGRSINQHVLMVKEMVHLLSSNARGGNCIIKLDLSKAFDRISWKYLEHVLLRFGFSQRVINLLLGNLRSTFFSVLVNGQPKGFFPMKCGVKQGDPLSPLLFILAMEGFTRNLLRLKAALSHFGNASGQAINFNKSQVIVHDKMRQEHKAKIRSILGIRCHTREFTYLGSVIVKGKLKKIHCQGLLQKFERRIAAWYSRKLNQMGRLILIKHVLSSIPLHILAVQEIPRSIVKCLHMFMANFFWGARDMGHKYHWRKWEKLCFPLLEGGIGVRDLGNCQRATAMDLWWKVQQGGTIWSSYMQQKYFRDGSFTAKVGRTKDYGVRQYLRKGTEQSRMKWSSDCRRRPPEELSAATSRRPLGGRCLAAELADIFFENLFCLIRQLIEVTRMMNKELSWKAGRTR